MHKFQISYGIVRLITEKESGGRRYSQRKRERVREGGGGKEWATILVMNNLR